MWNPKGTFLLVLGAMCGWLLLYYSQILKKKIKENTVLSQFFIFSRNRNIAIQDQDYHSNVQLLWYFRQFKALSILGPFKKLLTFVIF